MACYQEMRWDMLTCAFRYIKELADRLNHLENQIQTPHVPVQAFDYTNVGDPSLVEVHTPSNLARKRTHSMSEGLQDPYGRPNWPSQDRGTATPHSQTLPLLTYQDFSTNGQHLRRPSFSDMTLAGNLIAGSNEGTIKA